MNSQEILQKEVVNVFVNVQLRENLSHDETIKALGLLVVTNNDKKALILQSADDQFQAAEWELPGGSVDTANLRQQICREVEEETSISLEPNDLEFQFSYDGYNPEFDKTYRFFVFSAKTDDEPKTSAEHQTYEWITLGGVEKLQWEGHKRAVQYVLNKLTTITNKPINQ